MRCAVAVAVRVTDGHRLAHGIAAPGCDPCADA
jgi:hypothetical protein